MLPEETVSRAFPENGSITKITFLKITSGNREIENHIRASAFHLWGNPPSQGCLIWLEEAVNKPLYYYYICFNGVTDSSDLLEILTIGAHKRGGVPEVNAVSSITETSIPVLKQQADGTLIRLWPSPGPDKPEKQRVSVEGDRFILFNRIYKIEGEVSPTPLMDRPVSPGLVDILRKQIKIPRIRIGLALKRFEPELRKIGFEPDPETSNPRRRIWAYVRKGEGKPQYIWFLKSKWGNRITVEFRDEARPKKKVRIGHLSDSRADCWWYYNSQADLEFNLYTIIDEIQDRGEKWFRGEIDVEQWLSQKDNK